MRNDIMHTQATVRKNFVMAGRFPENDFDIVKLCLTGDTLAFKELYERNVGKIYALCLRITANEDIADELTQEVFIKAWEKIKSFGFKSKFSTWLYSIAVNTFLMMKRNEKRFTEKLSELGNIIASEKPADNVYLWDSGIDLEKLIAELPEKMRLILILHDIEGYKHHEISKMLSIETGTSKAHLHKARKILREKFSK